MKKLFALLLIIFIGQYSMSGQCNPAAALTCEEAVLLCGLDELDGYSCTTLSISNPTGNNPLCNGAGIPENTQWWSFMGNGMNISITFNIDLANCTLNKGIEAGILDDGCGEESRICNAECNINSFTLTFLPDKCRIYYLWVDGCEGDICDYDIQITNGEAPQFQLPLPAPQLQGGGACSGRKAEICSQDFLGDCKYYSILWYVDGNELPNKKNDFCIEISTHTDGRPIEVCTEFVIGYGLVTCDQKITCLTFVPIPIVKIEELDIFVCWEEHEDMGYLWHDTLIYSSCINPPCNKIVEQEDGCFIEYTTVINLLEQRPIIESFIFICDTSELPYQTEDGTLWYEESCAEEIIWRDNNYYNCDTTYILFLEVFNPNISIITSCPDCNENVFLYSDIEYYPECPIGQTSWVKFWVNEVGDTVGIGDSITPINEGKYSLLLQVSHINEFTGEITTCGLSDTSWNAFVKHDSLTISGDSLICQKDTSEFFLPDAYSNGCEILWTIEDLDGEIITLEPEKKSKIEVYWPTDNTTDGKICAEIIDACDSVRKVCRTLEGCVTTQNNSVNTSPWKIFPNPARDVVYIEGNLKEMDIQMHDLHGNAISVQPKQHISGAISINVESLSSGVYFILLSEAGKSGVFKLLIL